MRAHLWSSLVLAFVACSRPPPQIDGVNDPGVPLPPTTAPAVEPEPCSGPERPGTVCIGGGWFLMSRWSTARWTTNDGFGPEPVQRVRLPSYRMDEHEVTNAEYASFVAQGAEPIPDKTGWTWVNGDPRGPVLEQTCGWEGGEPLADRLKDPVVCVLRLEAQAYCERVGGRLPTVAEWLKAGRGLEPDARRFPWGEAPPLDVVAQTLPQQNWYEGYAAFNNHQYHSDGPWTWPVYADALGKSPWGVLGLAGNASEHLSTCREDLATVYPNSSDLVAAKEIFKADCTDAILIAGSNWFVGGSQAAAAMTLFVFGMVPEYANKGEGPDGPLDLWSLMQLLHAEKVPEPPGNDWRDWRVGFRCVYDAE